MLSCFACGLNRFDGYEFQRIHSQASEDWDMPSNRFRNIWLAQDGNIYCKVDDDLLLFDLHSYRFRHISDSTECQQAEDLLHQSDHRGHFNGQFIDFIDRQGIMGGMEFPMGLAQAIRESKVFLFLASEK